jgi:hypothetical protein
MVSFIELITLSSERNRRSYCQYGEGKRNATTRRRRSAVLSIGPSLRVQRSEIYFRLFKAGGETVKEISFDAGLSLPALS